MVSLGLFLVRMAKVHKNGSTVSRAHVMMTRLRTAQVLLSMLKMGPTGLSCEFDVLHIFRETTKQRCSGCNETASYSWAANEYWQRHGSCDLNGTTELRDEPPPPSSDCKFLLDQVGDNGEKTITAFLESVPTPTAGTSGPGSNEDNVSNEAEKHGLKGGAKGGIAVGVLASVALACLAALYLLRRKKQSKKDASVSEQNDRDLPKDAMSPYVEEKHQTEIFELPDNQGVPGVFEKRRFSELPNGQHVSELAESKEVSELPVDRHVSELQ